MILAFETKVSVGFPNGEVKEEVIRRVTALLCEMPKVHFRVHHKLIINQ